MDADELKSVRQAGPGDPNDFESMAPFGLSLALDLAAFAAEQRTPLLLDF